MTAVEALKRADYFGNFAYHAANDGGPYSEIDSYCSARAAARYALIALAIATEGIILDAATFNARPGAQVEASSVDHWIAPRPCESQIKGDWRIERAQARNCLRVDAIESGSPRCINLAPPGIDAIRWLGSGGSPFVFGLCVGRGSADCPLNREK
jgi:hypothetical protein